jgi:two-component system cell cycle sensor histidine kinase/response regulator CckA
MDGIPDRFPDEPGQNKRSNRMTKAKILIVEDESIIASVIAAALKKFAYEVIDILNTGEAAAAVALQKKPDLILMDIRLLGAMDGISAAEQIQQHLDIPIIYLTAYADEPTLERAKKTRPYGYIPKPFQEIELKTTIEMALYKHGFEVQLKESEAKFRSLFENSPDVIYISDKAGNILEINPAGLALFGYAREEIIGIKPDRMYADPEDCKTFLRQIKNQKSVKDYELKLKNKKGDIIYGLETTGIMTDQKGDMSGFQGIIRDITERRRLETEHKNLEAQLFQAQKMEALGQLAGGVAHDFNNLLTGISGFTKFAIEEMPEGSASRDDLQEVMKLAKRAEALTRQLLAFSRRQTLQTEVLNINRTVQDMIKMLDQLIGENIEFVFALAPELGNVNIAHSQLEQVLMNLVINARDAMGGGGKLTIETANSFLDQDYAAAHIGVIPGEYVMLAVSDTGCGMDEHTCQHMFEPFFTTKPQGKGTGLGLSTVFGIVSQLKGSIAITSAPAQGTTVKIYLPREAGPAAECAPVPAGKRALKKGTILIVEKDPAILKVARRMIAACGYSVYTASLAPEAEKVMADHGQAVDLVLIDVMMPGRDGSRLFASWKKKYPQLRVLFMSGHMDSSLINEKILARGLPFIQKPFTPEVLTLKIAKSMGEELND